MINFIIGENASGKTLYLDRIINKDLNSHGSIEFVTNVYDVKHNNSKYNLDRISILEDISYADKVDTSNDIISILGNPVRLSKEFLQIITILCLECKRAYIDEPEQGLSEYEICLLSSFLTYTDKTFEDVFIVTHSELLIQLPYCEIYTPKMSATTTDIELIKVTEESKFEVID